MLWHRNSSASFPWAFKIALLFGHDALSPHCTSWCRLCSAKSKGISLHDGKMAYDPLVFRVIVDIAMFIMEEALAEKATSLCKTCTLGQILPPTTLRFGA